MISAHSNSTFLKTKNLTVIFFTTTINCVYCILFILHVKWKIKSNRLFCIEQFQTTFQFYFLKRNKKKTSHRRREWMSERMTNRMNVSWSRALPGIGWPGWPRRNGAGVDVSALVNRQKRRPGGWAGSRKRTRGEVARLLIKALARPHRFIYVRPPPDRGERRGSRAGWNDARRWMLRRARVRERKTERQTSRGARGVWYA